MAVRRAAARIRYIDRFHHSGGSRIYSRTAGGGTVEDQSLVNIVDREGDRRDFGVGEPNRKQFLTEPRRRLTTPVGTWALREIFVLSQVRRVGQAPVCHG
jgi:hypothetical protein